ncbi:asparagine synthase-related protein [Sphingomonas sp. ST-64]|uniref:asparagine synthase (glutamine-hydrolyzing) n=1 Tax=Sphingomonas plantiphila TaxID=3163295 RepID=A0ABW8YIZ3_9SPHN
MFCGQVEFTIDTAPDRVAPMLDAAASRARAPVRLWQDASARARFGVRPIDDAGEPGGEAIAIDDSADLAAVGNVRLDNRAELRAELSQPNTASDLDLVLAVYRSSGRVGLDRLYGDYAFVIWDGRSGQAICMRDHIGIVPFYYFRDRERIVFSSELEALARGGGVPRTPDLDAIGRYLDSGSRVPPDRTFLAPVRRLRAAHRLLADRTSARIERWWDPRKLPRVSRDSDADYGEGLRALLVEAVRVRLPRSGAVGSHMTGGLDSSSVATIAAHQLRAAGRPAPACFAWQPAPGEGGAPAVHEHRIIDAMVAAEGFAMQYATPTVQDVIECFTLDPYLRPIDVSLVQELPVMRAAETSGIRVMLSGWGGDDCVSFNGRGVLMGLLLSGQFARFVRLSGTKGYRAFRRAAGMFRRLGLQMLATSVAQLPGRAATSLRHPSFRRWQPRASSAVVERNALQVRAALLQRGHLQSRLDCWADSGARRGIVYRYPLLDRRLMEYALGLPIEQFRRGSINRYVMRRALDGLLPDAVTWNQDKTEQIRIDATVDAMHAARETLLALPGLVQPNARALSWIAMERVHDALKPDGRKLRGIRPGPAFAASRAIQFLGSRFL